MNVTDFIAKWAKAELKESSAAQEHFIDLCHAMGHKTPAEADPTGVSFCFERGAEKHGGGDGFADVWKKGFFGWEYKGKHKDLENAFDQLLLYKDALENPPLLVVCDMDRILVRTNFTGTAPVTHEIPLAKMGEPRSLEILRAVFDDPEKLKPGRTSEAITQDAAKQFAGVADSMRERGLDPAKVAHFLDRVVFCQFAEDIGLLPDMIFSRIVEKSGGEPGKFCRFIGQLFEAMAKGGEFGLESIRHFNGSLFDDNTVLELTAGEVKTITDAARLDWSAVDPSIFGTLFERGLDPAKRSQLGAHFTSKADIELLVDAVVMTPLRRDWEETKAIVENLLKTGKKTEGQGTGFGGKGSGKNDPRFRKAKGEAGSLIHQFLTRLANVKVLDPSCGSGNFLYVTLQKLKDLEKAAIVFSLERELGGFLPMVGPWQLYGIEINPYAHDLAQMTVWIGWLQWIKFNGFGSPQEPILRSMTANFRCMDSIIDLSDPANSKEPEWPAVDFVVGNPPFLGDKLMRRELGDAYVDQLRRLYEGRIPGQSDLCCYWFEKARAHIAAGKCKRAGLLATQGIRGGANREVLKHIQESGGIFWAESDRPWVLNGANVHVSMVAFDDGTEKSRTLDGKAVAVINANLTNAADTVSASSIPANRSIAFLGNCKGGPFDISDKEAIELLSTAGNPMGQPNSDVIRPVVNTEDLVQTRVPRWIIDSADIPVASFALYEEPFRLVELRVKPKRDLNRDKWLRENWWRPQRVRPEMRVAVAPLPRFLVTPTTAKHRIFIWLVASTLPDHQLIVFARSDDYFFGVMQSRLHQVWALAQGTQLREKASGFRYTPTTCFETFPLPSPTTDQERAIAVVARDLNMLRENWLNPPEWVKEEVLEFPGTVGGPWDRYIDPATVADRGTFKIGTVKYPRLVPRDVESAAKLAKCTLTNLYNQSPAWLADAHRKLDEAVFTAYGWDPGLSDNAILEKLLALNSKRANE